MIFTHDDGGDFSIEVTPKEIVVYLGKVDNYTERFVEQALCSMTELGLNIHSSVIVVRYACLFWRAYLWKEEGETKFSLLPPVGRLCSDCNNSFCPRFARREEFLDSCGKFIAGSCDDDDDDAFRF